MHSYELIRASVFAPSHPASHPASSVDGDGKSLSLRSHKSCGHGDWWNVKGSVCTYVSHYSDIRLFTSGFGVIAESRDSSEMQYTGLNTAVVGHGKRLSLHSRKSYGHGD